MRASSRVTVRVLCAVLGICNAAAAQERSALRPPPPPSPPSPCVGSNSPASCAQLPYVTGISSTEYLHAIVQSVESSLRYPPSALESRQSGTAVVKIQIDREGQILSHDLVTKTGFSALDGEAGNVFERVARLPPVPTDMQPNAQSIPFFLPIVFDVGEAGDSSPSAHVGRTAAVSLPPEPPRPPTQVIASWPREYLQSLTGTLAHNLLYPPAALQHGEEGNCLVLVHMARDGTILDTKLISSSGHQTLDSEALEVLGRIGRFPPVPDELYLGITSFEFRQPITFRLHQPPAAAPSLQPQSQSSI
jgi:protein TonB